jgi:hypothetical protein
MLIVVIRSLEKRIYSKSRKRLSVIINTEASGQMVRVLCFCFPYPMKQAHFLNNCIFTRFEAMPRNLDPY